MNKAQIIEKINSKIPHNEEVRAYNYKKKPITIATNGSTDYVVETCHEYICGVYVRKDKVITAHLRVSYERLEKPVLVEILKFVKRYYKR